MTRCVPTQAVATVSFSSRRWRRWVAPALLPLLLVACSGGPMSPSSSAASSSRPPFQTMPAPPSAATGAPAEITAARWQAILDDLAGRGVTTAALTIDVTERVTWPSSALGCPSPGKSYTQALTEGMRVVVVAGDRHFDYRFGRGDSPKLCER